MTANFRWIYTFCRSSKRCSCMLILISRHRQTVEILSNDVMLGSYFHIQIYRPSNIFKPSKYYHWKIHIDKPDFSYTSLPLHLVFNETYFYHPQRPYSVDRNYSISFSTWLTILQTGYKITNEVCFKTVKLWFIARCNYPSLVHIAHPDQLEW